MSKQQAKYIYYLLTDIALVLWALHEAFDGSLIACILILIFSEVRSIYYEVSKDKKYEPQRIH